MSWSFHLQLAERWFTHQIWCGTRCNGDVRRAAVHHVLHLHSATCERERDRCRKCNIYSYHPEISWWWMFLHRLFITFWNTFLVEYLSSPVLVIVQNLWYDLPERRCLQWLYQVEFKTCRDRKASRQCYNNLKWHKIIKNKRKFCGLISYIMSINFFTMFIERFSIRISCFHAVLLCVRLWKRFQIHSCPAI